MSASKSISVVIAFAAMCGGGCDRTDAVPAATPPATASPTPAATPTTTVTTPVAPEITGWGTLKGSFKFRGEIPKPREFPHYSSDGPKSVVDDSLRIDPQTRGIANVAIYALQPPRIHPDLVGRPMAEIVVKNIDCHYVPRVIVSTVGDKLVVLNLDLDAHSAKGEPRFPNRSFHHLLPASVGKLEHRFRATMFAPYDISCSLHPWEKVWHFLRPDPYFAVTAADGTFEIAKLPAGTELEFRVWHERSKGADGGLQAGPDWSETGTFRIKIPKDGATTTMDVEVDAAKFRE